VDAYSKISFIGQVVEMVEPVVPAQVVLKRNAQFYLAAVVDELQYQVVVIEVKTGPYLPHSVVTHH
jgi:hypothetical protein